jgi:inactivated superfamily I helicase
MPIHDDTPVEQPDPIAQLMREINQTVRPKESGFTDEGLIRVGEDVESKAAQVAAKTQAELYQLYLTEHGVKLSFHAQTYVNAMYQFSDQKDLEILINTVVDGLRGALYTRYGISQRTL